MKRIILSLGMFGCLMGVVNGRDLGQWDAVNPEVREWYQALMQPDVPNASCCGEADAYWADEIHVKEGKTYATITDDRPDEPRGRPHVAIGTEIEIPTNKLKWDRSKSNRPRHRVPEPQPVRFLLRAAGWGLTGARDWVSGYVAGDYFRSRSSA